MPRRLTPDCDLIAASLAPTDRATIARWEQALGLPPGGWRHVPPLRDVLFALAALQLASDMADLSATAALAEACAALGLADDTDRDTRPADSVARRLRRWIAAAHAGRDTDVRSRSVSAA